MQVFNNMEANDELLQNQKKRGFVVKEIISTERTYLSRLKIAIEVYAQPMKFNRILDSSDCSAQFDTLEKLLELHNKYYVTDEDSDSLNIEALFNDISNNFQIYSQYLVDYEPTMQRRGSLLTSSRKYSDFLDKTIKDPKSQGQNIESLLIMPVQRIPRYRLLLEQLLKYTPEDHLEHPFVKSALDKICNVAMFNNEAIRARENKTKMMSIMMQIEPRSRIDLLDDSQRVFIKDAPLLRQCRRGLKEFHFWLFNDKLLYGQAVPLARDIFILNREIPLNRCFVKLFDSLYDADRTFMVESPAKSFIVRTKTEAERNEWLKAIQDAIEKQRERISNKRGSVAPLWIPDATSSQCQKCHNKFTLINRRHHCRNCGGIVCDPCSNQRILISHVDEKKEVRVCNQCHYLLTSSVGSDKVLTGSGDKQQQQQLIGDDEYYNSDEEEGEDEGEGEESTRGAVNDDQLDDFNENYDELAETLRVRVSTGNTPQVSPNARAPIVKRPSVFGGTGGMSTLLSDMTKILTPRTRTTINLGSSPSSSSQQRDGAVSPVPSPIGNRNLPPTLSTPSGRFVGASPVRGKSVNEEDDNSSDSSAKQLRRDNPILMSLKRNQLFNACVDSNGARTFPPVDTPPPAADRSSPASPSGDVPVKPPKPLSVNLTAQTTPRVARRTNLLLRPEDMPKDFSDS